MRGMGNMGGMMKQMQKLQKEMGKAQAELNEREFTVEASQVVTVVFTGDKKLKSITLNPEAIDPEDVEFLEEMIAKAVNDGLAQVEAETEKVMGKYTKGLPGF